MLNLVILLSVTGISEFSLHLKKNGKIASGETVTEIVKKYKTSNWIGLIGACVSLEIIENSSKEMSDLDIPFGFKANLWNVEEPLPLHKFNRSKFNRNSKPLTCTSPALN